MTRLRTKPRHEKQYPGKQLHYDQTRLCVKCRERKQLAGSKSVGGRFTCKECKEAA